MYIGIYVKGLSFIGRSFSSAAAGRSTKWTKGGWEILIYDQDEIMRATKSGPLLFCSKIPVLVLAPSTGKPPPPSRKASIVLRARGHTAPSRPRAGVHPDFSTLLVIDCPGRLRLRLRARGRQRCKSRLIRRPPELGDATQKWRPLRLSDKGDGTERTRVGRRKTRREK